MNDRTQGYFVRAIGAGIILDVVIEVIREIAFEIRTGGTDLPFRYGLVDWRTSVFKTTVLVALPLLIVLLECIPRTRAAGKERVVFYTTLILSLFAWRPLY
jgi:hypothetical protein